jgi:hypothetical protein
LSSRAAARRELDTGRPVFVTLRVARNLATGKLMNDRNWSG